MLIHMVGGQKTDTGERWSGDEIEAVLQGSHFLPSWFQILS